MTPTELIADLRGRINPAYAEQIGTESYERRQCVEALEALLAETAKLHVDAERYRRLRKQHWSNSAMAIVFSPKEHVQLGTYCPSEGQLDAAIDEIMAASRIGGAPT